MLIGVLPRKEVTVDLTGTRAVLENGILKIIDPLLVDGVFATPLDREVAGAFAFGIVYAEGRSAGLTPPEVHALALFVLQNAIGYAPDSAVKFADVLIRAAQDEEYHDTLHALIHRGIDAHLSWRSGRVDRATANLEDAIDYLRNRKAP